MSSTVEIWREREARYRYWGRKGRIVSWTKIAAGGYWVVMVEIGKERTVGQLVESRGPEIGDRVIGVMRRLRRERENGVIEYGVKFKYE